MTETEHDLLNYFTHHSPTPSQQRRYELLRAEARTFAQSIVEHAPVSPERDLAIDKLRECVMWANNSIACNEFAPRRQDAGDPEQDVA